MKNNSFAEQCVFDRYKVMRFNIFKLCQNVEEINSSVFRMYKLEGVN